LSTAAGEIQVITLPWLTRSALLTRTETEGLSMGEVGKLLIDRLTVVLEGEVRQLDDRLPTILLAHVMVDTATYGAERFLAAGKGFTIPLALLCRSEFDYVALGHVHRHQILCQNPLVVYPGSIERVDFGEEKEEKGYCWLEISKGATKFEFCPLPTRPFRTIQVDVSAESNPQTVLLKAIASCDLTNAIARLRYTLKPEQIAQIDHQVLHQAMAESHNYAIVPEVVSQMSRARLPELKQGELLDPISALKAYLGTRHDLKDYEHDLIQATHALLQQTSQETSQQTSQETMPLPNPPEQQLLWDLA